MSIEADNYLENKSQSDIKESASQNKNSESQDVINNTEQVETFHNNAFQSQSRAHFNVQPDTEDL